MTVKLTWIKSTLAEGEYSAQDGRHHFLIRRKKTSLGMRWKLEANGEFITMDTLAECKKRAEKWLEQEFEKEAVAQEAGRQNAITEARDNEEDDPEKATQAEADLRKERYLTRLLREFKDYCKEAEHQDGYEYWLQFDTEEDFLSDFGQYLDYNNDPPLSRPEIGPATA